MGNACQQHQQHQHSMQIRKSSKKRKKYLFLPLRQATTVSPAVKVMFHLYKYIYPIIYNIQQHQQHQHSKQIRKSSKKIISYLFLPLRQATTMSPAVKVMFHLYKYTYPIIYNIQQHQQHQPSMQIRKSSKKPKILPVFAAPTGYYNEPGCEGDVSSLQVYISNNI